MNIKLFLLTIIIFIVVTSIQIYHIINDGTVKYICNSFGNFKERPFLTILWIIMTLLGNYIYSYSPKLSKNFFLFYQICTFLLIYISNLDYKYRNTLKHKVFQQIHYLLTILFFAGAFFIFQAHIKSRIIILFYIKFVMFCSLHLAYYLTNQKHKYLKKASTILELLLFYILCFSVLIKISLRF